MKVLHINMCMDSVNGGGTVERTTQLHKAMHKVPGVFSHILTMNTAGISGEFSSDEITLLPCVSLRWFVPSIFHKRILAKIKWSDVVCITNHWTMINAWVVLLCWISNKKYIFCPAGALNIYGRSIFIKHLYNAVIGKKIVQNADILIAITNKEKDEFGAYKIDKDKILVVPNGVSENDFQYDDPLLFRNKFNIAGSTPYILFVGRINAIKGPDILLQAFLEILDDIPHALVIAGPDGGMLEELKQTVSMYSAKDRVFFPGHISAETKSSAYFGADIVVIPSRHEAMSIVVLEASICGNAIIMTDACGFEKLHKSNGAIEVKVNKSEIAHAITTIACNEKKRNEMGDLARQFARCDYTWEVAAKKYIELITRII